MDASASDPDGDALRYSWTSSCPGTVFSPSADVLEPLVLFGYLAALTRTLELCTGILISPQRQTALLAKQAAEADVLSGGRIRFVIAAGWNDVEYEALNVDFKKRGKIMEEQFVLMRELWSKEVVTYHGHHHTVTAAGINSFHARAICRINSTCPSMC